MACIEKKQTSLKQTISPQQLENKLQELAAEIIADLSAVEVSLGKELLSDFVSQLFISVAQQQQKRERLQKQAEGIAEAKARGVRFGRPESVLPENFDQIHQDWRAGKITLRQAADACGMPEGTFYSAASRKEQTAG